MFKNISIAIGKNHLKKGALSRNAVQNYYFLSEQPNFLCTFAENIIRYGSKEQIQNNCYDIGKARLYAVHRLHHCRRTPLRCKLCMATKKQHPAVLRFTLCNSRYSRVCLFSQTGVILSEPSEAIASY